MPSWASRAAAVALGQRCAQNGGPQAAIAWIVHHAAQGAMQWGGEQQQPPRQQAHAAAARGTSVHSQPRHHHQQQHWRASSIRFGGSCASYSSSAALAQQPDQPSPQPRRRARVLDGRAVASDWLEQLRSEVPALTRVLGRPPVLVVVLVGSRPDSVLYVSRKQEAAARVGVECRLVALPEHTSQEQLTGAVAAAAAAPGVDGLLVQLPLPRHLDEEGVMEALAPVKDVDGFHPYNMGRMLMRGRAPRFVPATPLGVVQLLSRCGVGVRGRTAVMLGDSNIVGQPLAALLRDEGAALVTTCHRVSYAGVFEEQADQLARAQADVCLPRLPGPSAAQPSHQDSSSSSTSSGSGFETSQLPAICRTADILVVAVGSPELVRAHWVKPGAVVVDIGINVIAASTHEQQQQQQQQLDAAVAANSSLQLAQGSGDGEAGGGLGFRVVGDVAADEVAGVASVLTPVPGGVGPVTVAALLHNTLQAARYRAGLLPW